MSYVSLLPVYRNVLGRVIEYFRRKLDKRPLRPLAISEPYYSSVALAKWKRSYLRSLLRQPGTIWKFEHTVTDEPHYAVWERVLHQSQIVKMGFASTTATCLSGPYPFQFQTGVSDVQVLASRHAGTDHVSAGRVSKFSHSPETEQSAAMAQRSR